MASVRFLQAVRVNAMASNMNTTRPRVSVIVPVYNARRQIGDLLSCLRSQTHPVALTEFIIVDDGSTDDTAAFVSAHFPECKVVRTSNGGSYHARNAGIAVASGEVFAFTDADCRPEPDWLRSGLARLETEQADLVAGAVLIESGNADSATEFYDLCFGINQEFYVRHLGFGATANLFAKRQIVERVQGFDASLRSGGDNKFCTMARQAGATLVYEAGAVVRHELRKTWMENYRKIVRVSKGLARVYPPWRHFSLMPLSQCRKEYFDYQAFRSNKSLWFRVRFRSVYYSLRICFLAAYAMESLAASR